MSPTPSPQASSHALLSIGAPCSAPSCHLVDFLPFKCAHCAGAFCQEHFVPAAHVCPAYDERVHDRVVPNCPACDTPIAIPPGQSPDVRMDMHLARECPAMPHTSASPSSGKKKMPVCKQGRCGKVLYAPIKCAECKGEFCPAHRFAKDHTCSTSTSSTAATTSKPTSNAASRPQRSANLTANSRLLELNAKASSAGAAIKKSVQSAASSGDGPAKGVFADVKSPFNKTDSSSSPSPAPIAAASPSSTATSPSPPGSLTASTTNSSTTTPTPTTTPTNARCVPKPALSTSYAPPPLFVF